MQINKGNWTCSILQTHLLLLLVYLWSFIDDGGGMLDSTTSGAIKYGNGEGLPDQQIHLVTVI